MRATSTSIGKDNQLLHSTAGVTFLAAEGGEEDIRLRGFSLAQTGDIFADGLRDPAFYERDTFNEAARVLTVSNASRLTTLACTPKPLATGASARAFCTNRQSSAPSTSPTAPRSTPRPTVHADGLYTNIYIPGSGRNLQLTMNIKF